MTLPLSSIFSLSIDRKIRSMVTKAFKFNRLGIPPADSLPPSFKNSLSFFRPEMSWFSDDSEQAQAYDEVKMGSCNL